MTDDPQHSKPSNPREMYEGLRSMMLKGARPRTIPNPATSTEPWGVLMDWGVQNGTATVMSMSDGSASVYLSSGGGYIGGQGIVGVRTAAQKAVEEARAVRLPGQPTVSFPPPESHEVIFHLLTDSGVYTLRTDEQELKVADHPLRKLGDGMQSVITQFRMWRAAAKSKADQGNADSKQS